MLSIPECLFVMLTMVLVTYDGILLSKMSVTRWFKVATSVIAFIAIVSGASAYLCGLTILLSFCTTLFVFSGILLFPIFLRYQKE